MVSPQLADLSSEFVRENEATPDRIGFRSRHADRDGLGRAARFACAIGERGPERGLRGKARAACDGSEGEGRK